MSPKHVALLTGTFSAYSGIDRVVADQARELAAQGHEVTIMALEATMAPPAGVRVLTVGLPRRPLLARIYRLWMGLDQSAIRRAVEQLAGCQEIYSHQYPMNLIAMAAQKKNTSTYIYYNHGIPPASAFPSLIEKIYITLFRWQANHSLRSANKIISISRYLQKVLRQETGLDSEVVHDRADTSRFHPGLDGQSIRQRLALGTGPVALYVGRLSPHKGLHLLLSAWTIVHQQFPQAKLVIAGKPTFAQYFRRLQKAADASMIFPGFVTDADLPSYYAACDVYTTATQWEGFDLPIAEAQACGKPVVAFDIGPHSEIADDKTVLVPAGDVAGFAQAVIDFFHAQAKS